MQLDSATELNEHTFFSSFHSEKRKFVKGHEVELDALKEPLNGACCQIAFSAVVFKVKNISVRGQLEHKSYFNKNLLLHGNLASTTLDDIIES